MLTMGQPTRLRDFVARRGDKLVYEVYVHIYIYTHTHMPDLCFLWLESWACKGHTTVTIAVCIYLKATYENGLELVNRETDDLLISVYTYIYPNVFLYMRICSAM